MPCYDGGPTENTYMEGLLAQEVEWRDAALCAVLTAIENKRPLWMNESVYLAESVLDKIDWVDAGIKRKDFDNWWANHKEQDRVRRKREAEERARKAEQEKINLRKAQLKKTALAKLTVEEAQALGILK